MQLGKYIADNAAILYILDYYVALWLINAIAYGVATVGMRRWAKFTAGLEAERALTHSYRITGFFGITRLMIGSVGLLAYAGGLLTPLETIFSMGVTSLLMNTLFILGEGIVLNREANLVADTPAEGQDLLREAMRQFEALRRTVKNA